MKLNPNLFYDINIIWEDGNFAIDLSPSKSLLNFCMTQLNEYDEGKYRQNIEDEAEIIKVLTVYINKYIQSQVAMN